MHEPYPMRARATRRKSGPLRHLITALVVATAFNTWQPQAASRPVRRGHAVDLRAVPLPAHKNPYREYPDCDPEKGSCLKALVTLVGRAMPRSPIIVSGYDFSDVEISDALGAALDRRVDVGIIVSRSTFSARGAVLARLRQQGADVFVDSCAGKPGPTAVIDNFVVVTGRFHDRDEPGEQPQPAMQILHNSTIAMVYVNEWVKHYRHSHQEHEIRDAQVSSRAARQR
jgi:hypothetical protein